MFQIFIEKKIVDFDTCPHARERNGVLADEVISDELVVKDDESD